MTQQQQRTKPYTFRLKKTAELNKARMYRTTYVKFSVMFAHKRLYIGSQTSSCMRVHKKCELNMAAQQNMS